jgi:hypothetical protein
MAVTKLDRKLRRTKAVPKNAKERIKQLLWKPEIKKVDIEVLKAEYAAKKA